MDYHGIRGFDMRLMVMSDLHLSKKPWQVRSALKMGADSACCGALPMSQMSSLSELTPYRIEKKMEEKTHGSYIISS